MGTDITINVRYREDGHEEPIELSSNGKRHLHTISSATTTLLICYSMIPFYRIVSSSL